MCDAAEAAPEHVTGRTEMWTRSSSKAASRRREPLLLARHGRAWDADLVAAHLMSCQRQMVLGLGRRTPWAGLDAETLDSCFGHGAAVIARVAASGQRPEWRTAKDLEKAQVAAFRHQALDHWKRVNAHSRRGDRLAVAFDPERHAAPDAPMDKLFEQPDLLVVQRDLLVELEDLGLRAFWRVVLTESVSFKAAGDQLGLDKAEVMARTRAGRTAFAAYLDRRETGELCEQRSADILALRAGAADERCVERAEAHLEACYACSLVHTPHDGAIERGILGAAPVGFLLRLAMRAGDVASVPTTRWTEAGTGARLVAGGLAALTVAGTGAGIDAATTHHREPAAPPTRAVTSTTSAPVREAIRSPALVLPAATGTTAPISASRKRAAAASAAARARRSSTTAASSSAPATKEFSFEQRAATTVTPSTQAPSPSLPSPAAAEFAGP